MSSVDYGKNFDALQADLTSYGATALDLPIPDDPYNWRRLQFHSLQALDYPVELRRIPAPFARQAYESYVDPETGAQGISEAHRALCERQFKTSSSWRLPVVWAPGLAEWVRYASPNLAELELSYEQHLDLSRHPGALLPGAVDLGYFRMIKTYRESIVDNPPYMADGHPLLTHRKITAQCYATAFDRFVVMVGMEPSLKETEEGTMERPHVALRRLYSNSSIGEGIHPQELTDMLTDFYVMLGSAVPQFAEYRSSSS